MININTVFENAVESWRKNGGRGTMICPKPLDNKLLLLMILERMYKYNPTCKTTIIVNNFNGRLDIIDYLTKQENEENNEEFNKIITSGYIKILTQNYVENRKGFNIPTLSIIYEPESFKEPIISLLKRSCFKLIILNKLFTNSDERLELTRYCPVLDEFKQAEIDELRTTRPVEEIWKGVDIEEDSEQYKLLKYYNDEITRTLNIFGSLDNIKYALYGNPTLNQSAIDYCNRVAYENGWNESLDMNEAYNRLIDKTYNPATLRDRSKMFYELVRLRNNLVTDYPGKLPKICEICKKHKDEKILIINKRGEFASKVTFTLNSTFGKEVCGNYHNKVENTTLKNSNGEVVLVKTGINKGKPKEIGYQAQMTLNQRKFNDGSINILSTSNTPNKDLSIDIDVIIITSPLCETIKSYLYRLSNINLLGDKLKLYTIFCKSTIEHKHLLNKEVANNHVIVNKDENMDISTKNLDFVLGD